MGPRLFSRGKEEYEFAKHLLDPLEGMVECLTEPVGSDRRLVSR